MFARSLLLKTSLKPPNIVIVRTGISHRKKYLQPKTETRNSAYGASLQVIGSGASDQPAAILLNLEDRRYLFNCGDGMKRLCFDAKVPLGKTHHAFFTKSKWDSIGGVTNLLFETAAFSGQLPTIHGPDNLFKIFKRMSYLSILGHMFEKRVNSELFRNSDRFEDSQVVIKPVKLQYLEETAIMYVCKLKEFKGSFSLNKFIERNLPTQLMAQLHRGEDVTLDDGSVVTAKEVQSSDYPETHIIFIDVPSIGFLQNTSRNDELDRVLKEMKAATVEVIVHFTPDAVYKTKLYQTLTDKFGAKKQLLLNDSNKFASMNRCYNLQQTLHQIDPKIHPLLSMKLDPNPLNYKTSTANTDTRGKLPTLYTKYELREGEINPLNECNAPKFDNLGLTKRHYTEISKQRVPLKLKDEVFPRILFLGTGAAASNYFRSSSAILVHISKEHSILLDCGSGTASQIHRFYGNEAPEIFRRLRAVFVSHIHLDHHIGLPELFRWRRQYLPVRREPLRIICPFLDLRSWLLFYANNIDPIHADMKFIDNNYLLNKRLSAKECRYLNVYSMVTCAVEHYRDSYAIAMTFPYENKGQPQQFKLAYSGDTGLSKQFTQIGLDADLLIHEATFGDEAIENAKEKRHSTVSIALEQSKRMQAQHTILTHFSQRNAVLPYINDRKCTSIAFDYMEITPRDLPRLDSLLEQYKNTFPNGLSTYMINSRDGTLPEDAFE